MTILCTPEVYFHSFFPFFSSFPRCSAQCTQRFLRGIPNQVVELCLSYQVEHCIQNRRVKMRFPP